MFQRICRSGRNRSTLRSTLAGALLVALAASSTSPAFARRHAASPGAKVLRYAVKDDRMLRLSWSGDVAGLQGLARNDGAVELVVEGARDPARPLGRLGVPRGADAFELAAATPSWVSETEPDFGWERLSAMRLVESETTVSLTYVVGADRLSLSIPRAALLDPDQAREGVEARLVLNEHEALLDAGLLLRLGEGSGRGEASGFEPEADRLLAGLTEPERFVRAVGVMQRLVAQSTMQLLHTTESCMADCVACGAGVLGVIGATGGIGLACGGAALSGGLALPACLISIVGGASVVLVASVNCHRCDVCVLPDPDPRPNPQPGPGRTDQDDCEPCPDPPPCGENALDPACDEVAGQWQ